jgi:hypothetical protein
MHVWVTNFNWINITNIYEFEIILIGQEVFSQQSDRLLAGQPRSRGSNLELMLEKFLSFAQCPNWPSSTSCFLSSGLPGALYMRTKGPEHEANSLSCVMRG